MYSEYKRTSGTETGTTAAERSFARAPPIGSRHFISCTPPLGVARRRVTTFTLPAFSDFGQLFMHGEHRGAPLVALKRLPWSRRG
jgi:hypothetical protein